MFSNINVYELIGFIASVIIAISLTMSSILKLRWYNLIGASIFSIYGFLIGSMPVALLNLFISLANIYYLRIIYAKKEHFKVLPIRPDSFYLEFFLDFYHDDIIKSFPDFDMEKTILKRETRRPFALIILRDAAVAGVVLGYKTTDNHLFVILDYVIPAFRDLKPGKFLFLDSTDFFRKHNILKITTSTKQKAHRKYLEKLGFVSKKQEGNLVYLEKHILKQ